MDTRNPSEILRGSVHNNLENWRRVQARHPLPLDDLRFRAGVLETFLTGQNPVQGTPEYQLLSQIRSVATENRIEIDEYDLIQDDPRIYRAEEYVRHQDQSPESRERDSLTELQVLYEGLAIFLESQHS